MTKLEEFFRNMDRNNAAQPEVITDADYRPAMQSQVGGSHYLDFEIQPVEFCQRNGLGHCESAVVKYICRHKLKNGVEDLLKAKDYIDKIIELQYP